MNIHPIGKNSAPLLAVCKVIAKYVLLLTYSDLPALPDHLLQITVAKTTALTFITTSSPPILPKDTKIHLAS